MSAEEIAARAPMAWRAWVLWEQGAITTQAVGRILGVTKWTAQSHIRRVRQMLGKEVTEKREPKLSNAVLTANGRCTCGLLLPCECVPSIYAIASHRPNAGT